MYYIKTYIKKISWHFGFSIATLKSEVVYEIENTNKSYNIDGIRKSGGGSKTVFDPFIDRIGDEGDNRQCYQTTKEKEGHCHQDRSQHCEDEDPKQGSNQNCNVLKG